MSTGVYKLITVTLRCFSAVQMHVTSTTSVWLLTVLGTSEFYTGFAYSRFLFFNLIIKVILFRPRGMHASRAVCSTNVFSLFLFLSG